MHTPSIMAGIILHFIGAASAACFYAPFKKVDFWSWETMWSIGGIVSWIIVPLVVSAILLPNFLDYYSSFSMSTTLQVLLFGMIWGIGNIGYGLTVRYLGMSMGIGIAIGVTLIFGTLVVPLVNGNLITLFLSFKGNVLLTGMLIALMGITLITYAGKIKEKELNIQVQYSNFYKGLSLAIVCGFFSSGMSLAMNAAEPMRRVAEIKGVNPLYSGLPSYVIIMGGGALVNLTFCFYKLFKNSSKIAADFSLSMSLVFKNIFWTVTGGCMWYLQFFFYAWGHAYIPKKYNYISWMLHMSFYVLCGGLVGYVMQEWKNVSSRTLGLLGTGCILIVIAANVVGISLSLI